MGDALNKLSRVLWQQRQALERLLFRVEVQQLLLAAGRTRWMTAAAADVEHVLDDIRHRELERAVAVVDVAGELGLSAHDASLQQLVEAAPEPWNHILTDHRSAFLALTAEVEQTTRHNRELLNRGLAATRDLLASLAGDDAPRGYGADGSVARLTPAAHLVDRAF
jgi:flagellar biosynthesis/type III secretory pathway chaperone